MSDEQRSSLEEIFAAAVEKTTPEERAAYLDGACGADAALRDRLDALLAAHLEAGSFLSTPAAAPAPAAEGPGSKIGNYKLLQLIGEGGFGVVYMAEQEEPVRRRVALKIIKLGMDTKQVIARFEAERQALALTDHPNISKVLDAGSTTTGRPYFVMELVRGISLTKYCDQVNLTTRKRLELFVPICQAVQHAHRKGIIHRDLKPGNVLVTMHDGVPVPKVIDFGIARATNRRLTEKTLFTEYGQFIGTPEYMSPEQAEMSGLDIDTRADIYSLGVMLYELLTGTTPLDPKELQAAGYGEIQRIIREEEPPIPSTRVTTLDDQLEEVARCRRIEPGSLHRIIRGDLDWIVMKAMEKDRTRRYGTASEMAEDIRRHLTNEPVLAGPPTLRYKVRKFVRRHRVGVLTGLVVAAAILGGLALATMGFVKARREADRSQLIADSLQDLLASTDPDRIAGLDVDIEEMVETARKAFGDDHGTVAAVLSTRALQLQNTGNLSAAEPVYREALEIWRRHGGDDHPLVGFTLGRLGTVLRLKGDVPGAEKAYREAIRIAEAQPGERTVALTGTLAEYASLLVNRGEYEEAYGMFEEAIRIRKARTPNDHLTIALLYNALASSMVLGGHVDRAEALFGDLVTAFREGLPAKGSTIAKVLSQVGFAYLQRGKLDEAEALLSEAIDIYAGLPDGNLADRKLAGSGYFRLHMARDDGSPEAVAAWQSCLSRLESAIGKDDPLLGEVYGDYSGFVRSRGRLVEAVDYSIRAVEILHSAYVESHRLTLEFKALANVAWEIVRRPGREKDVYLAAERGVLAYLERRPDVFAVVNTLGVVHYRLGRYEEALETLARSDAHYTEEKKGVPADVAFIAMAEHRLGNAEKARAALARLKEIAKREEYGNDVVVRELLLEAERLVTGGGD